MVQQKTRSIYLAIYQLKDQKNIMDVVDGTHPINAKDENDTPITPNSCQYDSEKRN